MSRAVNSLYFSGSYEVIEFEALMTIRYCCIEGNRIMLSTLVTDIEAAGPLHSQFSLDPMEASDLADGRWLA